MNKAMRNDLKDVRVALMTSPTVFQYLGGLNIQIRETLAALQKLGLQAELVDPVAVDLSTYDVIHAFSAINGCQRIIQHAKAIGKVAIGSPLIRPHWTRSLGRQARFLDRVVGKLTGWNVQTEYRHIASFLHESDHLIALGPIERQSINQAFNVPLDKISIVPNGIPQRFFKAEPDLFCREYAVEPGFVLNVAEVCDHKNQLTLVRALAGCGKTIVIVGETTQANESYLREIQRFDNVKYVGRINYSDPLLASAYAAAGAFCLPSNSEVMPLSVLESLAAGTKVVMTDQHGMDASRFGTFVRFIRPHDEQAIKEAVLRQIAETDAAGCRQSVTDLTWESVATQIAGIYLDALRAAGKIS